MASGARGCPARRGMDGAVGRVFHPGVGRYAHPGRPQNRAPTATARKSLSRALL